MQKQTIDYSQRRKKWRSLRKILRTLYPDRKTELNYSNPWELLVAVILSAQCTDDMVNRVTEKLFKKYPTLADYIAADIHEFEKDIYSTGFYHAKTRHVLGAARMLQQDFGGVLPSLMSELTRLPGVGRKTANVVLQNIYGIMDGIAVDTHVLRFAARFGLSGGKTAEAVERDLMNIIDQSEWMIAGYWIKQYGRTVGKADKSGYQVDLDPLRQFRGPV